MYGTSMSVYYKNMDSDTSGWNEMTIFRGTLGRQVPPHSALATLATVPLPFYAAEH
jgi:hypothetical protein